MAAFSSADFKAASPPSCAPTAATRLATSDSSAARPSRSASARTSSRSTATSSASPASPEKRASARARSTALWWTARPCTRATTASGLPLAPSRPSPPQAASPAAARTATNATRNRVLRMVHIMTSGYCGKRPGADRRRIARRCSGGRGRGGAGERLARHGALAAREARREVARDIVPLAGVAARAHQRGHGRGAGLLRPRAARVEDAALGRVRRAGHVALEDDAPPGALGGGVGDRHRREQRLGVRVLRLVVEHRAVRDLNDLAEVHDGHAVGGVLDHRQVVGDEDVRQFELVLKVLEEVDHLRPDGHVEGAHRLVADDELRVERQGAGDADALALPARELVRVALGVLGAEPDGLEQLEDALLALGLGTDLVDLERLADDVAHAHARIQRGVRVLEDDLHVAAQPLHLRPRGSHDVDTLEGDRAGRRRDEPQHGAPRGGLAAAALADQTQGLALLDREADAVDGVDLAGGALEDPRPDGEVLLQPLDLEQAHLTYSWKCGKEARTSRRSASGIQQFTPCSGPTISSTGHWSRHSGRSYRQRPTNGQPLGREMRSGGCPRMGVSRVFSISSSRGSEPSRPQVYGWCGL